MVVYQSVLRRSDRGVCFFVLLSQYHCLEEAESKGIPSISLFYTVPVCDLFYILKKNWLQYTQARMLRKQPNFSRSLFLTFTYILLVSREIDLELR